MPRASAAVQIEKTSNGVTSFIPVYLESEDVNTSIVIETRAFSLEEFAGDEVVKRLQGVSLEMSQNFPVGMLLYVAHLESPNEEPDYGPGKPVVPGEVVHLNTRKPFHRIRILDLNPRLRWQINAIGLYGRWGKGRRRNVSS